MRLPATIGLVSTLALALAGAGAIADDGPGKGKGANPTATPIKHLVVIFQENISFDHYFATYPRAENLPGETPFTAQLHPAVPVRVGAVRDGRDGLRGSGRTCPGLRRARAARGRHR